MAILVPVADGSEDIETVSIIDVLRRAERDVVVASAGEALTVTAARGTRITADAMLSVQDTAWEMIALPGGLRGAENLARCQPLQELLRRQDAAGRWIAAICAAPALVLAPLGLLDSRQATCYPAFRAHLAHWQDRPVVQDGHLITSQGPGTALAFGLQLVAALADLGLSQRIGEQMLVPAGV